MNCWLAIYQKEKDMLGELIKWLEQQDGANVVPHGFR